MRNKTVKKKPSDIFERFPFALPGHVKFFCPNRADRYHFTHVAGNLYRWPETKIKTAKAEPLDTDESAKKAFLTYDTPHEKNVVTAYADAAKALSALANLAREGNGKALWQFAEIVNDAVNGLNEIVTSNPDAIKPFARLRSGWALMRSTAPHLCDDDSLLTKIELGKSLEIQLDKHSKWKPDAAAQVASELKIHIESIRRENPFVFYNEKRVQFSSFYAPFSRETAPQWWSLAEKFLRSSYPKPEAVAELDAMVTGKTKRKYASSRRNAILAKIRARFIALAI
jgi:hypothetical protein